MWPRGRPAVPLHSDPPGGLSQAHAHRCLPLSAPGLPGDRRGLCTPLQRAPLPCPAAGARTPRPALLFLRCCSFRPGPAEFPGTAALQEAVSGCLARGAGVGEAAQALLRPPPRPPPFSGALRPEPWGGRGRRSRPGPAGFQRGRPSHRCRPGERNPRGGAASLQPEVAQYARPGPRRASQRNKAERSTSRSKQTGRHATP